MLSLFSQFIFGNSSLFTLGNQETGASSGSSSSKLANLLWKDRSLCFDLRQSDLEINFGEQLIAAFFPIEDVKGNQDEIGLLKVTNLRLIWICCNRKRVNLSIGWRTVSLAFEQNLKDPLGRPMASLCIISKFESTKYEFVFDKMKTRDKVWNGQDEWDISMQLKKYVKPADEKTFAIRHLSPMYLDDLFEVVFKVWHCYKQTSLFRHCRANLTNLMPRESIDKQQVAKLIEYSKLAGEETIDIYNHVILIESRSTKHVGSLILTNIRLIWIDATLPLRNLSVPYIRVDSMKIKQNRLLIKTLDYLATSNQIELNLEKSLEANKIKLMLEQVQNLYTLYKSKPKFGPECCEECLNYMSHLRPAEHFLDFDGHAMANLENLGPITGASYPVTGAIINQPLVSEHLAKPGGNLQTDEIGNSERELGRYRAKLNSYLDDQFIERDKEIMYSKELGLAIERPMNNNLDIDRIWRLDL